ncbi:MAG: mannosyltransferase family protein [Vicinamibacterales bacterium]
MPSDVHRAPATVEPVAPRGIAVMDGAILALAAVAVSVALTGGFREDVAGLRLSVTSWPRVALLAAGLLVARHAWWRWPLLPVAVWRRFAAWRRDDVGRVTWSVTVTTRVGVLVIGLLSVYVYGYPGGRAPFRVGEGEFVNLPARFDAGWYMNIASVGYRYQPDRTDVQQNLVFFPAFPFAMRGLSLLLARQVAWSGVLLSVLAFAGALRYLFRLARELMDEERAAAAVTFLAAYPFALFFSAPYTEGLFLLAMLGAWWHARRDERWAGFGWGLVAGLTRPNGCLLSVPLALSALLPLWRDGRLRRPAGGWSALVDRLVVAAAPGIGMLIYSAFVYERTGDPFMWIRLQAAWGREHRGVAGFIEGEWQSLADAGLYDYATRDVPNFLNALGAALSVAAVVPVWRRFGLPAASVIVLNLAPSVATGGWLSVGRATAVLFPVFLWLGSAVPARHRLLWVAGFAALQAFAASMFFTWRQLF